MTNSKLYIRSGKHDNGADDLIKSLGGDPKKIAEAAGYKFPDALAKSQILDWASVCRFFELVAEMCDEPNFGLMAAMHTPEDVSNVGPITFMAFVSDNLRSFIKILLPYLDVHTNGVKFEIVEDEVADTVSGIITLHPSSPPCRQYFNHIMATGPVLAYRQIPNFNLDYVTFQYEEPEDLSLYEKVFKCPIYFNAERNMIVANRKFLGKEHTPPIMKAVTPILKSYLDWRTRKLATPPQNIRDMVAGTLPTIMGTMNSDVVAVAKALELHPKKLQRLLADEHTNYSDVLDDVRQKMAKRLLVESNMSITKLARLLDYSSDRPFTHAAKRWWGVTPSHYRKSNR